MTTHERIVQCFRVGYKPARAAELLGIGRQVVRSCYQPLYGSEHAPVRREALAVYDKPPRVHEPAKNPRNLTGCNAYCSRFACGRKLSLIESLAGNTCTKCM